MRLITHRVASDGIYLLISSSRPPSCTAWRIHQRIEAKQRTRQAENHPVHDWPIIELRWPFGLAAFCWWLWVARSRQPGKRQGSNCHAKELAHLFQNQSCV